ncbi:MAG: hypothetical protein ACKV2U_26060 [Bryobacteraceae bacterium]
MQWLRGRSLPPEDQRRARLLRVLESAATQTRYARGYERDLDRFERLPTVDLLEFLCHTERYAVENVKAVRERLHYPLGEAPRTAVIGRQVEQTRRVRCFSGLRAEELHAFAPQSLAAPLDALRASVAEAPAGMPLRNAVVAFTGILEGPLMPEDGDRLWRRYQVPVFEQFLGMDGELLAWECEMHHGLHVREQAALFETCEGGLMVSFLANPRLPVVRLETGLMGRLIGEACPCGEASPRLVDVRRRSTRRMGMGTAGSLAAAAAG